MQLIVSKTEKLKGEVTVPASKSHTIRAVIIASLAEGTSVLDNPLFSEDTKAAIHACRALGAKIEQSDSRLTIEGFGSSPEKPADVLDMLNSGTSTNLVLGILAALGIDARLSGDASLCTRPVAALADALTQLGCSITYLKKDGCPPLDITGRLSGGTIEIDAGKSSQYVSSLLIACPLSEADTEIIVHNPTELPYIDMTLKWLDEQQIRYDRTGYNRFAVFGGQRYRSFKKSIPADWSSAAFPICAAAVTDSDLLVKGVDLDDVQGDKAIVDYLAAMGADINVEAGGIRIKGNALEGKALDINATPDALPALSVIGCHAAGSTKLYNVAQARVKETDRISVMATELSKMGAAVSESPDGLALQNSRLQGNRVHGHHDHRVVMALSIAGMIADGTTTIDTAEAVSVTYPGYITTMQTIGANFTEEQEA